jgi:hypothetical protein
MKSTRTSWLVKLRPDLEPKVVPAPGRHGGMLVPTPLLVAEQIRRIRRGTLSTPTRVREALARKYGAAVTCPLTTGIFLNIIAGAAEEQIANGRRPVAPYWRVIQEDGTLSPKRPHGPARQAERLKAEGHRVKRDSRKGWRVERD